MLLVIIIVLDFSLDFFDKISKCRIINLTEWASKSVLSPATGWLRLFSVSRWSYGNSFSHKWLLCPLNMNGAPCKQWAVSRLHDGLRSGEAGLRTVPCGSLAFDSDSTSISRIFSLLRLWCSLLLSEYLTFMDFKFDKILIVRRIFINIHHLYRYWMVLEVWGGELGLQHS